MLNLGITRDKNQLASLIQKAEKKNIRIVPLPVTEIKTLLTDKSQIPDLAKIDWLFFSSANGVHTFFAHSQKETLPHSLKIAAVGEKTAEAVNSYNLEIHFQPTEAYGKNLFEEFKNQHEKDALNILYIRAELVNYKAEELFAQSNIKYNQLITYKSQEHLLEISDIEKFTDTDYILFTAPSSVNSFHKQFGKPKAKLIAIGNSTKNAIDKNNWTTNIILDKPEIESVLEYI